MKNSFSAVSLFSGAGGMDVGFEAAGFETLFANDLDKDACKTYSLNISKKIEQGDVRDHFEKIQAFKNVDMLFGGPPCQGFSVAGKMNPEDERSKLLLTFFDVVDLIQPRSFVCENVKALGELDKWSGIRSEVMRRVSDDYMATMVVLSANDFGVPQRRDRVFCIGIHKSCGEMDLQSFESLVKRLLANQMKPAKTVRSIIRSCGKAGTASNQRICNAKITFARSPVLRKSPYAGMLFNGAGRPLCAKGYASTLPASMGGNKTPIVDEREIFEGGKSFVEDYHSHLMSGGAVKVGQAPEYLRRLTIDECLLFQTFPKKYKLYGRQSSLYRQIGNAVPCLLAKSVATVAHTILSEPDLIAFADRTLYEPIAAQ